MDNYTEQILVKKPGTRELFMMLVAIAVVALGVIGLALCIMPLFAILVLFVGAMLITFAKKNRNLEYEYIFTNEDCEITRIVNKESRKVISSFDGSEIQRVLKYSSIKYDNLKQSNQNMKVKNYTSGFAGKENQWFVFLDNRSDTPIAMILELDEKSQNYIKNVYKKKYDE